MFKRLRKMYELSKKEPKALEILENLTPEQLAEVPDEGDGKAEFFGEGSEEELEDFEREQKGMKGWYERLKNL